MAIGICSSVYLVGVNDSKVRFYPDNTIAKIGYIAVIAYSLPKFVNANYAMVRVIAGAKPFICFKGYRC